MGFQKSQNGPPVTSRKTTAPINHEASASVEPLNSVILTSYRHFGSSLARLHRHAMPALGLLWQLLFEALSFLAPWLRVAEEARVKMHELADLPVYLGASLPSLTTLV